MLDVFIRRPVLSTVISIIMVMLGILGLIRLPISEYPEIAPPTVVVSASYPGANADVVMRSVIVPLEEQINGVENMTYMTSTAGNDGSASITVFFQLGTDPDLAAVNVQNRASKATSLLPADVVRSGVTTAKSQSSMLSVFSLYSVSDAFDQTFLQNYLNINLLPEIKRINGVGDAQVFSASDYSMRIWLNPERMAAYGLMPSDIESVLAEQNLEAAPGKVGENDNQSFQYTIKYKGRLQRASEFADIVVRAEEGGKVLRLSDVARVELGSFSYANKAYINGHPSVASAIFQTSGSNARELVTKIDATLENASRQFPAGIKYKNVLNANEFLNASIKGVISTLLEAFLLVVLVVFIFLQDLRSSLIPAVAVPVSIIGTFFFLSLFGFTLNLLTLFALVLAIGIVVDDAIVVVEAVHAKLDSGVKSGRKATSEAMGEIGGAIVSITLVMAAVFVPVSFITGSAGVFYRQFGLTLAVAIVISAFNALTLSPALCALVLGHHEQEAHTGSALSRFLQRFYAAFNVAFTVITGRYRKATSFFIRRKWVGALGIVGFSLLFWWLIRTTPTAFVPNEDQGVIFGNVSLPPGSSQERTEEVTRQVVELLRPLPEVETVLNVSGRNFIAGAGSSYALIVLRLKPWDKRAGKEQSVSAFTQRLFSITSSIRTAKILFFSPPTLRGFGRSDGFEFQLQDRTGGDINRFNELKTQFLAALSVRPEVQYATSSFNTNFPQYQADLNVTKIKDAKVSVNTVLRALQGYFGGIYASDFNLYGKQYRVMIQADAHHRGSIDEINAMYVRNVNNEMIPISEFVTLRKVFGPESISRFNLFTAIAVQGAPKPEYSSGDAIKAIEEVAAKTLPNGYTYEFSGLTREEILSGGQTVYIFILSLLFVYFLLSAQYESYILPLAVLTSLPMGLAGAFAFARIFGIANNIYLQITLIMLVGLLAKNAILIVEFAIARRRAGIELTQAAIEGAVARLRPILMTSFAFIFGLLPLALSSGAGAVGNRSIGTGAIGGMLVGTVLGVLVIPALFVFFQHLQEKISGPPAPVE